VSADKLVRMTVAAIVLAAGASRRLGQPKQLLMLDGETMIGRALRLAAESGASPVLAVLGAHSELMHEIVLANHATPILNRAWEQGLSTSIHAGLTALAESAPGSRGALVLACDQPRLTTTHLRALLQAFDAQPTPTIVASTYAGVLGTPAVFPREVFSELLSLSGDKGARSLLMQPPCAFIALPFEGGEIDIDLPSDLAQLKMSKTAIQ